MQQGNPPPSPLSELGPGPSPQGVSGLCPPLQGAGCCAWPCLHAHLRPQAFLWVLLIGQLGPMETRAEGGEGRQSGTEFWSCAQKKGPKCHTHTPNLGKASLACSTLDPERSQTGQSLCWKERPAWVPGWGQPRLFLGRGAFVRPGACEEPPRRSVQQEPLAGAEEVQSCSSPPHPPAPPEPRGPIRI